MRVLFTTNILSFYRVNFFNELGKYCDLTIAYEQEKEKGRAKGFYDFNHDSFNVEKARFSIKWFNNLLKNNYDIIIIGTYATKISALFILLLKLKKIKFFINADGGFIDYKESKISKFLKTFFISKASYYLSSGNKTNEYLEYYGANKKDIFKYPFTSLYKKDILDIPLTFNEKVILRKKYNLAYEKIFLSVGQFIYRKGYDIFLKSLLIKNYKESLFILLSGGEEKENFIKFMKENNINNVLLIDYCDKEKLKDFYKMADAFFFPSREDIWGLVINEAMAYGLPIISSNNVLASLELLDKKYLYDVESCEQLSKKLDMLNSLSQVKKMKIGQDNINIIKQYTIENMAKRHIEIFNKVLKNEKNKRI